MKSFLNYYNRSKFLLSTSLQNTSFELPILVTNRSKYYNDLNQVQKDSLVWVGGANNIRLLYPIIVNGVLDWKFPVPFPWGVQCFGLLYSNPSH